MSFITSGAWARPVQDASTALLEGGALNFSFENDVAKDIYDITLNRAVSYYRRELLFFWAEETSVAKAQKNIKSAFLAAAKLYDKGRLSEAEATIALAALNVASNGDYNINAEEAKNANLAIDRLGFLSGREDCGWSPTRNTYCNVPDSAGPLSKLFKLFKRAKDLLYTPSQQCDSSTVMGLGLLFVFYDFDTSVFTRRTPAVDICRSAEEYYGEHLEEANERMTTAIDSMVKFYPQYWK